MFCDGDECDDVCRVRIAWFCYCFFGGLGQTIRRTLRAKGSRKDLTTVVLDLTNAVFGGGWVRVGKKRS